MIKKIILGAVLLILIITTALWWLGARELKQQELAKQEEQKQAQIATEKFQQQLDASLRAVSTTTLEVASEAIVQKQAPLARLDLVKLNQNQYTFTDLTLAKQDTASARQAYQASLKKILTSYSQNLVGDELAIMLEYLETRDTAQLTELEKSWQNLDTAIAALARLTVPASASFLHLQLQNSLASLRQIIYNMSQVASEPLLASESADQRAKRYLAVVNAIGALDRYLQNPITPTP
ncbi:MAG: hypothetical protein AAB364_02890 [Patescibacteria group bacterium]